MEMGVWFFVECSCKVYLWNVQNGDRLIPLLFLFYVLIASVFVFFFFFFFFLGGGGGVVFNNHNWLSFRIVKINSFAKLNNCGKYSRIRTQSSLHCLTLWEIIFIIRRVEEFMVERLFSDITEVLKTYTRHSSKLEHLHKENRFVSLY